MRTKLPASYRVQPKPDCCQNCRYVHDSRSIGMFCNVTGERPSCRSLASLIPWEAAHEVEPLGICDHYEAKAGH